MASPANSRLSYATTEFEMRYMPVDAVCCSVLSRCQCSLILVAHDIDGVDYRYLGASNSVDASINGLVDQL